MRCSNRTAILVNLLVTDMFFHFGKKLQFWGHNVVVCFRRFFFQIIHDSVGFIVDELTNLLHDYQEKYPPLTEEERRSVPSIVTPPWHVDPK